MDYWENYWLPRLADHLGSQMALQSGGVELTSPEGFQSIEKISILKQSQQRIIVQM